MDKQGKLVTPAIYDYAFPFSEGMAAVYKDEDGGWLAFIDRTGKQITPFKFRDAQPFSEALAAVSENENGPYGFIDKTGNYAIPPTYTKVGSFHEGKAMVGSLLER
jgi:hypothetical protein